MCGVHVDLFLKFEFEVDRSLNVGAVVGQKSPLPIQSIKQSFIWIRQRPIKQIGQTRETREKQL